MKISRSLIKLIVAGGCVLSSQVFPPMIASELGGKLLEIVGNVAVGNTANALDALTEGNKGDYVPLENADLTKAVGKAIAAVIALEAERRSGDTAKKLKKIAATAKENWVEIFKQELTQATYPELREAKLDQFLTPEEYSLTQQGNLTQEEWKDIFIRLNMKTSSGGGFEFDSEVYEKVAQLLYEIFPTMLRQTLKEDFKEEGKAFAGLTLQLLTEIKSEVQRLQNTGQAQADTDYTSVLEKFEDIERQLRGNETQQQKFFQELSKQISKQIDIETDTQEKVTDLHDDYFDRLREAPSNWRQRLKQPLDWSATSNDLTEHSLGIDKTVSDIYIGLGLMGRKKRDRVQDVSPTGEIERESEEKEVIKNYDNREFLEALQQGNTEKSQGRKIAIIGDPGAGKTTLLKMIGESLLSQAENIVVWISLADLQGQKLEDYLYQRAGVNIAEEQNRFQEWFKQESVCLLLDGVDEMGEASASSQLGSELSLQSWLTSARIILTCRLNTWDAGKNTFSGFDVFRTLEFTPDQVNQFIQKWFAQKTERGEQLKTELQNPQHSRLRELIKNPLRLTMLCSIWEGDNLSSLPETQAKLYRLYVDWFYDWKYDRFRISNQERQELNKRLGQLAIQKLDAKTSHFRLLERQDRIGEILGNYFETALQLGWLEQVGVASESLNQKVYTFLHPTFQEYFAACAIDDWDFFLPRQHRDRPVRDQNGEYKRYRIFESQWKQVILLWVGRRDRVDQVKEEQERKEFIFHLEDFEGSCSKFDGYRIRTHCLIAACIPELSGYCWMLRDNPESPWADEFVKYIVRLAVVNRIPQAQEALKETDSHRVGRFSIAHLDDEYPWVRWAAAEALQGNTDSAVVLALLARFDDENGSVRWAAAEALQGNTDPAVVLALLARLNDENGRVREAAALALAGNTDSAVVLALLARLDDENERVRWAAALALAGNTDSAVVLAFLARLDDENGRVREAAALALAGNTDSAVVLALLARLDDENGRVREANVL